MSERERIRRSKCRIVFKTAWKYIRCSSIDSMSWALRIAWQRIRVGGLRICFSKIKGTSFERRQEYLRRLSQIDSRFIKMHAVRQYDSRFDNNAIQLHVSVMDGAPVQLGFVSKELARQLSPHLDQGCWIICMLETVTGGTGKKKYGANYSFSLIHI